MIRLNALANNWANWMVKNGAAEDNFEIYAYGAECIFSEIIANICVFGIAFALDFPLQMLVWQIFWLPLRLQIGGFHSRLNHIVCTIVSTAIAVGSVLLIPILETASWLVWPGIGISGIITFALAPVVHPNHPMSERRVRKAKMLGKFILAAEALIIVISYFTAPIWVSLSAYLGMLMACIMCVIGKIANSYVAAENDA